MAQGRFSLGCFGLGSFGQFSGWVFSALVGGLFWPWVVSATKFIETRKMFMKHYAPNRCLCIKVANSIDYWVEDCRDVTKAGGGGYVQRMEVIVKRKKSQGGGGGGGGGSG